MVVARHQLLTQLRDMKDNPLAETAAEALLQSIVTQHVAKEEVLFGDVLTNTRAMLWCVVPSASKCGSIITSPIMPTGVTQKRFCQVAMARLH